VLPLLTEPELKLEALGLEKLPPPHLLKLGLKLLRGEMAPELPA